jgi:hypothetical protein
MLSWKIIKHQQNFSILGQTFNRLGILALESLNEQVKSFLGIRFAWSHVNGGVKVQQGAGAE